jgi:hypothetical protein
MERGILSSWYVRSKPACCSFHAIHRMGDARATSRDFTDSLQWIMGLGSVKVMTIMRLRRYGEANE